MLDKAREKDDPAHPVAALRRMDLTLEEVAALLRYWGDQERPTATIYRRVAKFLSPLRDKEPLWSVAALLRLMERTQDVWDKDVEPAWEAWEHAKKAEKAARRGTGAPTLTKMDLTALRSIVRLQREGRPYMSYEPMMQRLARHGFVEVHPRLAGWRPTAAGVAYVAATDEA